MSVLLSPAVASEESEKNPKTDPTAAKRSTRTPTGRSEVPAEEKSHESVALGRDMKNRKVEHEAGFSGFTLAASSSFHLHNGDGGIANSGTEPNLCCLVANVFVCVREGEREDGGAFCCS